MFDLTSSKLLILGVVALIVVGPKELPFLLRTIGKYVAMVRRHANEFRAQFDEAMREAELDSIKKDLEAVARDADNTIREAQSTVDGDLRTATQQIDQSIKSEPVAVSESHALDGAGASGELPAATETPAVAAATEAVAAVGDTGSVDRGSVDGGPAAVEAATAAPDAAAANTAGGATVSEFAKAGT